MGKYINKSKIAGGGALSVKDISHQTTSGFRTRAALQRLRSHSNQPSYDADSFRYLQLRSRRLVINSVGKRQTTSPRANSASSEPPANLEEECGSNLVKSESGCSLEEKGVEFESGDRETTPCSLIRDSVEATQSVPSHEIEDFFAFAEQQQQRFFTEKYNFDIVSENPLPGRYEWIKVVP